MESLKDDLIWGAGDIAAELGLAESRVYYLLNTGGLPMAKKVTGRWVVSRTRLRSFFLEDREAA